MVQNPFSQASAILLQTEEQIAALERETYALGNVVDADKLHTIVRELVNLRRQWGNPTSAKPKSVGPSAQEKTDGHRKFDFAFDGESVLISGRGARGKYTQRVPLYEFMEIYGAIQGLAKSDFTFRDIERHMLTSQKVAPPGYAIYSVLRFLEDAGYVRKSGRGVYHFSNVSEGTIRERIHGLRIE
jgi:hypothetical protein